MKQIVTRILVCLLVLSLAVFPVFAEGNSTAAITSEGQAQAGGTVKLTVSLADMPAYGELGIEFVYDASMLKLVDGEWLLSNGDLVDVDLENGEAVWTSSRIAAVNGDVFTAEFQVSESVTLGTETSVSCTVTAGAKGSTVASLSAVTPIRVDSCAHVSKTEVSAKAADCLNPGNNPYFICNICGTALRADGVTTTTAEAETIPALGHSNKDVVTAPTCTAKGYTTHTCTRCGNSYVDSYVDALGHKTELKNAREATCTEAGYTGDTVCTVCGTTVKTGKAVTALGHSNKDVVTAPTCTAKGYTTHTCTRCGHSYVDSYVDALGHKTELKNVKEATCTEAGYTGDTVCTVCGTTVKTGKAVAALGHTYTDDQDTTCNVCGYVRKLPYISIYRLYNPYTQEHLLTGEAEKDQLSSVGWSVDGVAWRAPMSGIPIYRLYNPYGDFHFYTSSQEEIATLTPLGWTVDGVVSYSATAETGRPVYRLFNPYAETNYHIFTASIDERDWLASLGWRLEGIAWYCLK